MTPEDITASAKRITESLAQVIENTEGFGRNLTELYPDDAGIQPAFDDARRALERVSLIILSRFDQLAAETGELFDDADADEPST